MYNSNNWRNSFAQPVNQTPLPKEKTIREELEEQFRLEEERQRQQSLIPKADYSRLSLREELEARFRDLENEKKNQNMTSVPSAKPVVSSQSAPLPKNWLNSYSSRTKQTPVPDNLNMTQMSPQQLYSCVLPSFINNYPKMLPQQISEGCSLKNWNDKYKELSYMDEQPNAITTGNTYADKFLENLLWKFINNNTTRAMVFKNW